MYNYIQFRHLPYTSAMFMDIDVQKSNTVAKFPKIFSALLHTTLRQKWGGVVQWDIQFASCIQGRRKQTGWSGLSGLDLTYFWSLVGVVICD